MEIAFYKMMIEFTVKLSLPGTFTEQYLASLPCGCNVKLRIASGSTWDVKLEKLDNGRVYFTTGWSEFAQQMGLQHFEIVVFSYVGNDTFNVTVYGTNSVEKESNFINFFGDA